MSGLLSLEEFVKTPPHNAWGINQNTLYAHRATLVMEARILERKLQKLDTDRRNQTWQNDTGPNLNEIKLQAYLARHAILEKIVVQDAPELTNQPDVAGLRRLLRLLLCCWPAQSTNLLTDYEVALGRRCLPDGPPLVLQRDQNQSFLNRDTSQGTNYAEALGYKSVPESSYQPPARADGNFPPPMRTPLVNAHHEPATYRLHRTATPPVDAHRDLARYRLGHGGDTGPIPPAVTPPPVLQSIERDVAEAWTVEENGIRW
jgi:hypothetical protein